jgi:hypothetical protein
MLIFAVHEGVEIAKLPLVARKDGLWYFYVSTEIGKDTRQ